MVDLNQKGDDELRKDIELVIQEVKEDPLSQTCCIYKVARSTREKNDSMYTPTTISIGPFHNENQKLRDMERYKVIMLKRFRKRLSLDNLIRFVRRLEPKVRACYSEDTLGEKEFQRLMLLDGAFIIELFRSFSSCRLSNECTQNMDAILRQPKLLSDVTKDLLLLENQLPFFFLNELYQKAFPADHVGKGNPSFAELSYEFFGSFNSQSLSPNPDDFSIYHFTDLLRLFHLPKKLPERVRLTWPGSDVLLYSAKQLAEIDIKFKAASEGSSPLDLKFSNAVLEVPRIWVDHNTAILFHNMTTFEQCHYPGKHYLSDYALLLDCLINSQEDVNVLIRNGIIRNSLGDPSEVLRIFDGLYTDLSHWYFNSKYVGIGRELNYMGRDPWRQIKPILKSIVTGFVLNNILTLIQTIITIWQAT